MYGSLSKRRESVWIAMIAKRGESRMSARPKVLTLHNDASTCLFITSTLQQAGYEVDISLTGQEGLTKLLHWHPQCVIVNVLLPDMSGYAICRYVRQSLPKERIRIFLLSSQQVALDQSYGLRQGADHYLSQPLTAETLLLEMWEHLPEDLRGVISPPSPTSVQPFLSFQDLLDCTPRRLHDRGMMRVSSPFANPGSLKQGQLRRLYLASNGKKTVGELASTLGLKPEETARQLCLLLKEKRVQLDDRNGHVVEEMSVCSALRRRD
jgi:DNA-binding response OmpR family regulator